MTFMPSLDYTPFKAVAWITVQSTLHDLLFSDQLLGVTHYTNLCQEKPSNLSGLQTMFGHKNTCSEKGNDKQRTNESMGNFKMILINLQKPVISWDFPYKEGLGQTLIISLFLNDERPSTLLA